VDALMEPQGKSTILRLMQGFMLHFANPTCTTTPPASGGAASRKDVKEKRIISHESQLSPAEIQEREITADRLARELIEQEDAESARNRTKIKSTKKSGQSHKHMRQGIRELEPHLFEAKGLDNPAMQAGSRAPEQAHLHGPHDDWSDWTTVVAAKKIDKSSSKHEFDLAGWKTTLCTNDERFVFFLARLLRLPL